MSENGEIYTAGKNFTLPPALTAWTNSTSDHGHLAQRATSEGYVEVLTNSMINMIMITISW